MNFAPTYLIQRFFYRFSEFFRHWYGKSPRIYSNFVLNKLEEIDRHVAWKITLKNLFTPLYKDYSILGYIMGFLFRSARVFFFGIFYLIIFVVAIALYLIWLLIPPFIILKFLFS